MGWWVSELTINNIINLSLRISVVDWHKTESARFDHLKTLELHEIPAVTRLCS
jgi:hypothetical protein